jgi:hypothetical protein
VRYELVTKNVFMPDYSQFVTDYIEIDFVYGYDTDVKSQAPFANAVYLTDEDGSVLETEQSTEDTQTWLVEEGTNTPEIDSTHYYQFFKPTIDLHFSDDGGITFISADVREFSELGVYRWRMRWYELGISRNRVYKLICVSPSPIVILGAVQNIRKVSEGAN